MNFNINTSVVLERLGKIDESIDQLATVLKNTESNISGGWSSERSMNVVTPIIDDVKKSIINMRNSVANVRGNVEQYTSNVQRADAAGSLGKSSGMNSSNSGSNNNHINYIK